MQPFIGSNNPGKSIKCPAVVANYNSDAALQLGEAAAGFEHAAASYRHSTHVHVHVANSDIATE